MSHTRIEEIVGELAPSALLDVGCGCGRFAGRLAGGPGVVVGVDPVRGGSRWREVHGASGVHFCCMDGTALGFADAGFPLVVERDALHHTSRWADVVAEMLRVSSAHVVIEEPLDDLRSEAKRRTFAAQSLLLELQAEVGYRHYRHLPADAIVGLVRRLGRIVEVRVDRSDEARSLDEFLESLGEFVARSARPAYWKERVAAFRSRVGGEDLCEDDTLTVWAGKRGGPPSGE